MKSRVGATTLAMALLWALSPITAAVTNAPPELRIQSAGSTAAILSWPASAIDFVLEERSQLSAGGWWERVASTPSLSGQNCAVNIASGERARFFRLRYQSAALRSANSAVSFALVAPNGASGVAGQPFVVELRASFNALLAAAAVRVLASGTAGAILTGRSADPVGESGLVFLSATSQQPYENGLPSSLEGAGSLEVLLGRGTWPFDGVGSGEEVLLERLQITPTTRGELTISLGTVAAVTSRWARDGAPFEVVSVDPWRSSVTAQVEGASMPATSATSEDWAPGLASSRENVVKGQGSSRLQAQQALAISPNVDNHGAVDWADLVFVRARLGLDPALAANASADANHDKTIDLLDLVAVRNRLSPDPATAGKLEVRLNEAAVAPGAGQAPWIELKCSVADASFRALELRNGSQQVLLAAGGEPIPAWLPFIVVVFDGPKPREIITESENPGVVRLHVANPGQLFNATNDQCLLYVDGQLVDSVAWGPQPERNTVLNLGLNPVPPGGAIGRDGYEADRWVRFVQPTPGSENGLPTPQARSPRAQTSVFVGSSTRFAWSDPRYAPAGYELEVDDAADFATPLANATVVSETYDLRPGLAPGNYFWRVRSVVGALTSPWSAAQPFEVIGLPSEMQPRAAGLQQARPAGVGQGHLIPHFQQNTIPAPLKDSNLLCLECPRGDGPHAWDRPHSMNQGSCPHELSGPNSLVIPIVSELVKYYRGHIRQDEVRWMIYGNKGDAAAPSTGRRSSPEDSLGHGRDDLDFGRLAQVLGEVTGAGGSLLTCESGCTQGALTWDLLKAALDQNIPLMSLCETKAFSDPQDDSTAVWYAVVFGYSEGVSAGGVTLRRLLFREPAGGLSALSWDRVFAAKAWKPASPPNPTAYPGDGVWGGQWVDEDTDGDGLMDFDEINRFPTNYVLWDSDKDGIDDKTEVWSYKFGTGWTPRTPDPDGDGKRAEVDDDTDNDGCKDGEEDLNLNGTLGSVGVGGFVTDELETDPFSVDEFKLTLTAERTTVRFGECTRLEVTVIDKGNVPVETAYVRFTLAPAIASLGASGGAPVTTAFAYTDKGGKASTDFCALEAPGAVTVEASYKPCSNGKESKTEIKIAILGYDWIFAVQEKAVLTGPLKKSEYLVGSPAAGLLTGGQAVYRDCGHQKVSGYFARPTAREPGRSIDYIAVQFAPTVELLIDGEPVPSLTWTRTNSLQAPARWEVRLTWKAGNDPPTPPRYLEVGAGGAAGRHTPLLWWGGCEGYTERRRVYDGNSVGDPPQERVLSIDYANVRVYFLFGDGNSSYYDWVFTWPDQVHTGVSFIPITDIDGHKPGTSVVAEAPLTPSAATADTGTWYRYEIFNWDKAVADFSPQTQWSILRAPRFDFAELEQGLRRAGPMTPPTFPTDIRFLRDYIGAELKELQERKIDAPQYEIRMLTEE